MFDCGLLSCGQRRHSLIWLDVPVIRCAAGEPCCSGCQSQSSGPMSLPGTPSYMPNPEHPAGIVDQPVLSNQAWVAQYCCVCRKRVWGEQSSFSSRITGSSLLVKKKRSSPILPLPHFPDRAYRGDSLLLTLPPAQFCSSPAVCIQ